MQCKKLFKTLTAIHQLLEFKVLDSKLSVESQILESDCVCNLGI